MATAPSETRTAVAVRRRALARRSAARVASALPRRSRVAPRTEVPAPSAADSSLGSAFTIPTVTGVPRSARMFAAMVELVHLGVLLTDLPLLAFLHPHRHRGTRATPDRPVTRGTSNSPSEAEQFELWPSLLAIWPTRGVAAHVPQITQHQLGDAPLLPCMQTATGVAHRLVRRLNPASPPSTQREK